MTDKIEKVQVPGSLERPSFIPTSRAGTEDITRDDVRLPRIGIAQGLSPQITPDSSSYIDGLKLYDMFNDLTNEIYGRGPLYFVPVRRDVRRIEYRPRDEGGGVLDLNVPANDPRNDWSDENGERRPPRATKYVEFVVLLVRSGRPPEPIVLSIKDTNKFNRRASERLTGYILFRQPPAPIYAGMYRLETKSEKNDQGTFGVPVISSEGYVKDEALFHQAEALHNSLKGKNIVVEREPGDDTEFETSEPDPEAHEEAGSVESA